MAHFAIDLRPPDVEYEILANEHVLQALWALVDRYAETIALRFARRWKFPAWSSSDAVEAALLAQARPGKDVAALLVVPAEMRMWTRASRQRTPTDDVDPATIQADGFTFNWRPYEMSPKQARSKVQLLKRIVRPDQHDAMDRQIDAAVRSFAEAGYLPLPARWQGTAASLRLGARCRFRRLVDRQKWATIEETEGINEKTRKVLAKRWINELGISGASRRDDKAFSERGSLA
jgi:hypothetical protein